MSSALIILIHTFLYVALWWIRDSSRVSNAFPPRQGWDKVQQPYSKRDKAEDGYGLMDVQWTSRRKDIFGWSWRKLVSPSISFFTTRCHQILRTQPQLYINDTQMKQKCFHCFFVFFLLGKICVVHQRQLIQRTWKEPMKPVKSADHRHVDVCRNKYCWYSRLWRVLFDDGEWWFIIWAHS